MSPFGNEGGVGKRNYLKLPKEGESYDYSQHGEIIKIEKVENQDHKKSKFNLMKKVPLLDGAGNVMQSGGKIVMVDEDQGYFYSIEFSDGSVQTISSFSPLYALKSAGVMEGDTIKLDHPKKGEWKVDKI